MLPPARDDWTTGPAKWAAVVVLGAASIYGMGWSILTRDHAVPVPVQAADPSGASRGEGPGTRPADPPPAAPSTLAAPESAATPIEPTPRLAEKAEPAAPAVPSAEPTNDPPAVVRKINLNTATAAELDLLPGIGPALAERIIAERTARGRFTKVDDLDRVRGIGPRTMEKLRPLVTVD